MCLQDSIDAVLAAAKALKDAQNDVANFPPSKPDADGLYNFGLTWEEAQGLLRKRVRLAEARCREMGVHGPARKADPGDTQRILHQRSATVTV